MNAPQAKGYAPSINQLHAYHALAHKQAYLTPAELRLSLCIVALGGEKAPVKLSDRTWSSWTGMNQRSKEIALKGLKKKGFEIEGKGQSTKFGFSRDAWDRFVQTADSTTKPRSAGRRVDPKPAQKIHPECREHGCALLAREQNALESPDVAKPVSQTGLGGCVASSSTAAAPQMLVKQITPFVAAPIAKRVSQKASDIWVMTLAAIQNKFPMAGLAFLARLMAVLSAIFPDLTDQECAGAISYAFTQRRHLSAGLLLHTVPDAVAALRRGIDRPPAEPDPPSITRTLRAVADVLGARGAPFAGHVAEAVSLAESFDRSRFDEIDVDGFLNAVAALEGSIFETLKWSASEDQLFKVSEAVDRELTRMNCPAAADRDHMRRTFELSETFRLLGVPRLT